MNNMTMRGRELIEGSVLFLVNKDETTYTTTTVVIGEIIDEHTCYCRVLNNDTNTFEPAMVIIDLDMYYLRSAHEMGLSLYMADNTKDQFGLIFDALDYEFNHSTKFPLLALSLRYDEKNTKILDSIIKVPMNITLNVSKYSVLRYYDCEFVGRKFKSKLKDTIIEEFIFRIPWEDQNTVRKSTEWLA